MSVYTYLCRIYMDNAYLYVYIDVVFNGLVFKKQSKNSQVLKLSHNISVT